MESILQDKSGVAITFNWMFSLVAGVLIFSFLIYFAVQNTDLFGKVTARVVAEELDILFSGYETTQTRSTLDLGKKIELGFSCKDGRQRFTINDREGKTMWGKIVFAPQKIENDKINVATASWDVPFRVANFVYLWDKRYTLIGEIPDVDFLGNFQRSSTANIRFVDDPGLSDDYGTGVCSNDWGSQHEKVIYYKKNSDDSYFGYICFFEENGDVRRSSFYGEAMMIGAIFVDDKNDFDCIKKIAVDRLKIVNEVYEKRKSKIINLELGGGCDVSGAYDNAVYNEREDLENFDSQFDYSDVNLVKSSNERLIRGGCVGVY